MRYGSGYIDEALAAGRLADAMDAIRAWLADAPQDLDAHFYLAKAQYASGRIDEALAALDVVAQHGGERFAAYGLMRARCEWQRAGFARAIPLLQAATAVEPAMAEAWSLLAQCAAKVADMPLSVDAWRRYCQLAGDAPAWRHLGTMLNGIGDLDGAIEAWRRACTLQPDDAAALRGLAGSAAENFDFATAIPPLERMLEIDPTDEAARQLFGFCLAELGRDEEAAGVLAVNTGHVPSSARRLRAALLLPQIPKSADDIAERRAIFSERLAELEHDASWCAEKDGVFRLAQTNFLLAYQGQNDVALQRRYAALLRSRIARDRPELMELPKSVSRGTTLRIGFLSSFLRQCTVGNYFSPWIMELDPARFHRVVMSTGAKPDALGERLRSMADEFHLLRGNALAVAEAVRAANLDVLVYPEVGMGAQNYLLVNMRLAPLQCAAWGHPVTTGSSQIDVYLSCEGMEPPDAAEHYSESLALLPGLGTRYALDASVRPMSREQLGIAQSANVYVCPQSLFKVHPENDPLWVEILKRDPNAVILLFQAQYPSLNNAFAQRLSVRFAAAGIDARRQVKFVPRTDEQGFRAIVALANVVLDTLHWSGGNTSLDAIAVGTPIVTLPGEFMRGRQTMAMLRAMGCESTIATGHADYLDLALQIAGDRSLERTLRDTLIARRGALFDRGEPISALGELLEARATR